MIAVSQAVKAKLGKKIVLLDPQGKLVYGSSIASFAKENNLRREEVRDVVSGRRKSCQKWTKPILSDEELEKLLKEYYS